MRTASRLSAIAALLLAATPAMAQEPVVDRYALEVGMSSSGVDVDLLDRFLGNGTAKARLVLTSGEEASSLRIRAWRKVKAGEIVFALLCTGVSVRGFDDSGALAFSRDLEGFTFGDSAAGNWSAVVAGIPTGVVKLEVTFLGNYE